MCYVGIQIFHCEDAFGLNEEQSSSKQFGLPYFLPMLEVVHILIKFA
jgi:hypothetical protein